MIKDAKSPSVFKQAARLWPLLPGKGRLVFVVFASLGLVAFAIFLAHLIRMLFDALVASDGTEIFHWLRIAAVVIAGELSLRYLRIRAAGAFAENSIALLREKVTAHLLRVPMGEFTKQHGADYISRLTNDLGRMQEFVTNTLGNIIFMPLAAILALAYMLYTSWQLTLIVVLGTPLLLLVASVLGGPIGKLSKELQEKLAVASALTQESTQGMEVARAFNLRGHLSQQFAEALRQALLCQWALVWRRLSMGAVSFLLTLVSFFLCFGAGGYFVIRGFMTGGELMAFVQLMDHLTGPMSRLPGLLASARADLAAGDRIVELLQIKTERTTGMVQEQNAAPALELDEVDFTYDGREGKVLDGVSFSVKVGETVALVGASGSGKTTLLRLISRLYQPSGGELRVRGLDVEQWSLEDLRGEISMVAQDSFLFPISVRENILYGRPTASEEEVIAASKAAHAHDFIMSFPQGYATDVGELGGRLSGGQKQRLALARAILKDAPLLLLDEATSALDVQSEALVQEALERFMKKRTTLVVAHRLSTIINADRVVVLEKGRVVMQGSHHELLARGGTYADLYERQWQSGQARLEAV